MKLPDAHVTVRVTKVVRTTVSPRRALWVALAVLNLCFFVGFVAEGDAWWRLVCAITTATYVFLALIEDR